MAPDGDTPTLNDRECFNCLDVDNRSMKHVRTIRRGPDEQPIAVFCCPHCGRFAEIPFDE